MQTTHSNHKLTCKYCGDVFAPTKEDVNLFEEGFCEFPNICESCFDSIDEVIDVDNYSDADMGL